MGGSMMIFGDAVRLRIFLSNDDTDGRQPLYETILIAARHARLAGAIVLRGVSGYGRSEHIHGVFHGFAFDLPVVVEIVDTEARINDWLPTLEGLLRGGLVTIENVQTLEKS